MKRIIQFIFGVRTEGEKLVIPNCIKVRDYEYNDFTKWCEEFNVGCRTDRRNNVHITY